MATRDDFFLATHADFERCERPTRKPDYESPGGSKYWYTNEGVIRESDHWGAHVASCSWYLDGRAYGYQMHLARFEVRNGKRRLVYLDGYDGSPEFDKLCGFCPWDGFAPFFGACLIR